MEVLKYLLLLVLGFTALVKGADWFVDGSAGVAKLFRVPGIIIGLTIVAMGTSAPELAVSVSAALSGSNEIALSNVIGSNIFNLLVVLGVCAIIRPVPVEKAILRRDLPISLLACILIFLPLLFGAGGKSLSPAGDMSKVIGTVSRTLAIVLLVLFVLYILLLIYMAKKNKLSEAEDEKRPSPLKCVLLIAVGLALIIIGGQVVVRNARDLAAFFHMPETLIGLTVVALGTSLPELVTSIVAARKGENDLAVGNVVGSNIFNLFLILGVSATLRPIEANLASFYDLLILIGVSVVAWLFATQKKISRVGGAVFLMLYAADLTFAILR